MKQKVVIEVSLNGHNSRGIIEIFLCCINQEFNQVTKMRTKAMKIAVGIPGVESAAMEGDERDQLTVIGEGIDSVALVRLLRKKGCIAKITSVGPNNKDAKTAEENNPAAVHPIYYSHVPHRQILEISEPYYTPTCFNF